MVVIPSSSVSAVKDIEIVVVVVVVGVISEYVWSSIVLVFLSVHNVKC